MTVDLAETSAVSDYVPTQIALLTPEWPYSQVPFHVRWQDRIIKVLDYDQSTIPRAMHTADSSVKLKEN